MSEQNQLFTTQNLVKMALLSVIAALLMKIGQIPIPIFPSFLKVDFSEVPVIVGILAIHPFAGMVIVVIKNVLKLLIFGTSTGGVGELSNLIVSLGYILPLSLLVRKRKDYKTITIGILLGIVGMVMAGALSNYYITLPMYAQFMPMETIIEMGHHLNSKINSLWTLVLYAIVPFNLLKGILVASVSLVIVKAVLPAIRYIVRY